MRLFFVTENNYKFREAKEALKEFGIELFQVRLSKTEDKEASLEDVAGNAARHFAHSLKKPVVVEDTGIFFSAYQNFPGQHPKWVFSTIGYDGILRLLKGKPKGAFFKSVVAYCKPGQSPVLFSGELHGSITSAVYAKKKDVMPYERIFIPRGYKTVIAELPEVKAQVSHRAKAFKKLGSYLSGK